MIAFSLRLAAIAMLPLLAACQNGGGDGSMPGDSEDMRPFSAIDPSDPVTATGTEPFWNARVTGQMLRYSTPEQPAGTDVMVDRFPGRGGLSFSGMLDGRPLTLMVSEGQCTDGMSDKRYPFNATLRIGDTIRTGCAATDSRPAR